jgi:hypothetical protein
MLKKGESLLIEQVSNGFIVNPQTITGLTKIEEDVHVFPDIQGLSDFLAKHFERDAKLRMVK